MQILSSLKPVVDQQTEILIPGTLPGPESLASGQYYKKSTNSFWRIICGLYDQIPPSDYADKYVFLLNQKIGIWDVFQPAIRPSASDMAITNTVVNDFISFFTTYPNIRAILFNGKRAESAFQEAFPELCQKIPNRTAWSTS